MEFNEDEWIERIVKESGKSKQEIEKLIEEKLEEFGGMVSREGAIIIVGKELGIDLVHSKTRMLKIKNIVPGLNRVNFMGKVVKIFPVRWFSYDEGGEKKDGAVLNMIVGDETGTIRVSLWNEKTKLAESIKEGDVVEIVNGYARDDEFVGVEVRIGQLGSIKPVDDVEINVKEVPKDFPQERRYVEKSLQDIKEGDFVVVRACITAIFERQLLHYLCPSCHEKLDSNMKCSTHKEVEPDKFVVLSGVLDDGYGAVNFVAFRNVVLKLLNMKLEELEEKIKSLGEKRFMEEYVMPVVGEERVFKGLVKKNSLTGALEFNINRLEEVDIENTLKKLLAEISS